MRECEHTSYIRTYAHVSNYAQTRTRRNTTYHVTYRQPDHVRRRLQAPLERTGAPQGHPSGQCTVTSRIQRKASFNTIMYYVPSAGQLMTYQECGITQCEQLFLSMYVCVTTQDWTGIASQPRIPDPGLYGKIVTNYKNVRRFLKDDKGQA